MSIRTCFFWQKSANNVTTSTTLTVGRWRALWIWRMLKTPWRSSPHWLGNLKKNQQDWLGESLENSNCNLARWKGNVQRRKRRTPGFSHLPAFFSWKISSVEPSVFQKSNLRSCDFIEFVRHSVLPEVKLHKFQVSRFEVQLVCEAAVSTPRWYSL